MLRVAIKLIMLSVIILNVNMLSVAHKGTHISGHVVDVNIPFPAIKANGDLIFLLKSIKCLSSHSPFSGANFIKLFTAVKSFVSLAPVRLNQLPVSANIWAEVLLHILGFSFCTVSHIFAQFCQMLLL
jgi:hypothetical protein